MSFDGERDTTAVTIVYDASRLVLRFGWPAPNGIDRVDLTCARHFIFQSEPSQAVILTLIGPRLVPGAAAHHVIEQLEAYWGEGSNASTDAVWEARAGLCWTKASSQPR